MQVEYITMNIECLTTFIPAFIELVPCCAELYRKTSSLLLGFPHDSVMLRFSDVTSILESLAKFTRLSLTRAHRTSDRR